MLENLSGYWHVRLPELSPDVIFSLQTGAGTGSSSDQTGRQGTTPGAETAQLQSLLGLPQLTLVFPGGIQIETGAVREHGVSQTANRVEATVAARERSVSQTANRQVSPEITWATLLNLLRTAPNVEPQFREELGRNLATLQQALGSAGDPILGIARTAAGSGENAAMARGVLSCLIASGGTDINQNMIWSRLLRAVHSDPTVIRGAVSAITNSQMRHNAQAAMNDLILAVRYSDDPLRAGMAAQLLVQSARLPGTDAQAVSQAAQQALTRLFNWVTLRPDQLREINLIPIGDTDRNRMCQTLSVGFLSDGGADVLAGYDNTIRDTMRPIFRQCFRTELGRTSSANQQENILQCLRRVREFTNESETVPQTLLTQARQGSESAALQIQSYGLDALSQLSPTQAQDRVIYARIAARSLAHSPTVANHWWWLQAEITNVPDAQRAELRQQIVVGLRDRVINANDDGALQALMHMLCAAARPPQLDEVLGRSISNTLVNIAGTSDGRRSALLNQLFESYGNNPDRVPLLITAGTICGINDQRWQQAYRALEQSTRSGVEPRAIWAVDQVLTDLAGRVPELSQTAQSRAELVSILVRGLVIVGQDQRYQEVLSQLCRNHPDCLDQMGRLLRTTAQPSERTAISDVLGRFFRPDASTPAPAALTRPEFFHQLLAAPETRAAFQAAMPALSRPPANATLADVQALTALAIRVHQDLNLRDVCAPLTVHLQQRLSAIMTASTTEAAQRAAYDFLRQGTAGTTLSDSAALQYANQHLTRHPDDAQFLDQILGRRNLEWQNPPRRLLDHLLQQVGGSAQATRAVNILMRFASWNPTNGAEIDQRLRNLALTNDHTLSALAEDFVVNSRRRRPSNGGSGSVRFESILHDVASHTNAQGQHDQAERVLSAVIRAGEAHAGNPQSIHNNFVQDLRWLSSIRPDVGIRLLGESASNLNNRFALNTLIRLTDSTSSSVRTTARTQLDQLLTNWSERAPQLSGNEQSRAQFLSAFVRALGTQLTGHNRHNPVLDQLCQNHPDCVRELARMFADERDQRQFPSPGNVITETLRRFSATSQANRQAALTALMQAYGETVTGARPARSQAMVISEIRDLAAADNTGQSVSFLEQQCRSTSSNHTNIRRAALLALAEIVGAETPAHQAILRLFGSDVINGRQQTAASPAVRELIAAALSGDRNSQTAVLQLSHRIPQETARELVRNFTARNSDSLRFIAAVLRGDENLPARATNSQQANVQYREALNLLGQQLRTELIAATAPGQNNAAAQNRARTIIDLLALTAAGSGDRAAEAAHALMHCGTGSQLYAALGGTSQSTPQESLDISRRMVDIHAHMRARVAALLGERDLTGTQARYLMNFWAYQPTRGEISGTQAYVHREIPSSVATALAASAPANRIAEFRVIHSLIAGGLAGQEARAALAAGTVTTLGMDAQSIAAARASLTALQSQNPATLEGALTEQSLVRLARFAFRNEAATQAERTQIVQRLIAASGDNNISVEARTRAFNTVLSIVATGGDSAIQQVLTMMREGNAQARRLLYALSAGFAEAPAVSRSANQALLSACQTPIPWVNASVRNLILNELTASDFSGSGRLPLIVALLGNSNQLPTMEQARTQLSNMARAGNEHAISLLMGFATQPDPQPSESSVGNRQMRLHAVQAAYDSANLDCPTNLERLEDLGLGALMQRLPELLRPNATNAMRNRAFAALFTIAESDAVPRSIRDQAILIMQQAHITADEISRRMDATLPPTETAIILLSTPPMGGTSNQSTENFRARRAYLAHILFGPSPNSSQGPSIPWICNRLGERVNAGSSEAARVLIYLANNEGLARLGNNFHTSTNSPSNWLREAAEGQHAGVVRGALRAEARRGNAAATSILAFTEQGMSREEAIETLRASAGVNPFSLEDRGFRAEGLRCIPLPAGDRRLELIRQAWETRAAAGDQNTIRHLANVATGNSGSPEFRLWASAQLRSALAAGHGTAVADATLQTWRGRSNPAAFALLASVAAQLPDRADLHQAVASGYTALVAPRDGISAGELEQRRSAAVLALMTNRELLTPDLVRSLVQNMTPSLAGAMPLLFNPDITGHQHGLQAEPAVNVREVLNRFQAALRETTSSPPPNADVRALAQAWSNMAAVMTPQDVNLLAGLRSRALLAAEHNAIDQTLLNVITRSTDRAVTRAALESFRSSTTWIQLSSAQQQAVEQFATTGRTTSLATLRGACDTVFGAGISYPLAVTLRQLGLPSQTSDSEVCRLAERILARTGPGAIRTLDGWAMPLLASANLAWERCVSHRTSSDPLNVRILGDQLSQSYANRQQFLLAVVEDLANGNLHQSRQFLSTYRSSYDDHARQLRDQLRVSLGADGPLARTQSGISQATALWQAQQAYVRARDAVDNLPPSGQSPSAMRVDPEDEARVRNTLTAEMTRAYVALQTELNRARDFTRATETLAGLRQQATSLQHEERRQAAAETQSQYQMLVAQGHQTEADIVLLRYAGQGSTLNAEMAQAVTQAWARLGQQNLAPHSQAPIFTGNQTQNFARALDLLRGVSISPNLDQVPGPLRALHLTAAQAAADSSVAQIFAHPHVNTMTEASQEMALRLSHLSQLFELGSSSRELRPQIRDYLRAQVPALIARLNSQSMRNARDNMETVLTQLRQLLTGPNALPEGSIGRDRLEQTVRTIDGYLEIFRPGSSIRTQLDAVARGIERGAALDDETFWQQAGSTIAHVVATTAAFAAAGALSALAGPAAPVVWALLAPALTMGARHLTQELLYQTGMSHRSSEIGDVLFGRTFYDATTGGYRHGFRSEDGQLHGAGALGGHLLMQYGHEGGMNLAYAGVGRFFRAIGSARAGGSFGGALNPFRAEHSAHSTLWQRFRQEFNLHALGVGLGLGAPDLLGIEHGGEVAGFVLAAWSGHSGGLRSPSHTFRTATHAVPLTAQQRAQYRERLNGDGWTNQGRNAFFDALGHVPLEHRAAVLETMTAQTMSPRLRTIQSEIADPAQRAGFIMRMHELSPQAQQRILGLVPEASAPQAVTRDLASVIARLPNAQAVENLLHSLENITATPNATVAQNRQQMITRLAQAPAAMVAAIADIQDAPGRNRLLEAVRQSVTTNGFSDRYQQTLGQLPHELQRAFFQDISRREAGALRAVLNDVVQSSRGAHFAEALVIIPEFGARQAMLNSIESMTGAQRIRAIDALGSPADPLSRAALMRELGQLPAAMRANILEPIVASNSNASFERRLVERLAALSDVQNSSGRSPLQIALDTLAHAGAENRPRLAATLRELSPEQVHNLLVAAAHHSNFEQSRAFLQQVSRLSASEQVLLANVIGGHAHDTTAQRATFQAHLQALMQQLSSHLGSSSTAAAERTRLLTAFEQNRPPETTAPQNHQTEVAPTGTGHGGNAAERPPTTSGVLEVAAENGRLIQSLIQGDEHAVPSDGGGPRIGPFGETQVDRRLQELARRWEQEPARRTQIEREIVDELMAEARRRNLFARVGLTEEAVRIGLSNDASHAGGFRPWMGDIVINHGQGRSLLTLRHELQHLSRAVDIMALSQADPLAFRELVLRSQCARVGTGQPCYSVDAQTGETVQRNRATLGPEGRRLMREALREVIEGNVSAQDVLARPRFANLINDPAFHGDRSLALNELLLEQGHYRVIRFYANLESTGNPALANLIRQRLENYERIRAQNGGSLINHPEMIRLTNGISGSTDGIVDRRTYRMGGSRDESSARRATYAEGLRVLCEDFRQQGLTGEALRRALRQEGNWLISMIRSENFAVRVFEERARQLAEGPNNTWFGAVRRLFGLNDPRAITTHDCLAEIDNVFNGGRLEVESWNYLRRHLSQIGTERLPYILNLAEVCSDFRVPQQERVLAQLARLSADQLRAIDPESISVWMRGLQRGDISPQHLSTFLQNPAQTALLNRVLGHIESGNVGNNQARELINRAAAGCQYHNLARAFSMGMVNEQQLIALLNINSFEHRFNVLRGLSADVQRGTPRGTQHVDEAIRNESRARAFAPIGSQADGQPHTAGGTTESILREHASALGNLTAEQHGQLAAMLSSFPNPAQQHLVMREFVSLSDIGRRYVLNEMANIGSIDWPARLRTFEITVQRTRFLQALIDAGRPIDPRFVGDENRVALLLRGHPQEAALRAQHRAYMEAIRTNSTQAPDVPNAAPHPRRNTLLLPESERINPFDGHTADQSPSYLRLMQDFATILNQQRLVSTPGVHERVWEALSQNRVRDAVIAFEPVREQYQTILDTLCDRHGLPRIRVGIDISALQGGDALARYSLGEGYIGMDIYTMLQGGDAVSRHLVHEFRHALQDQQIIWRLADMQGIGAQPSNGELQRVGAAYEHRFGTRPSESFIRSVLAYRAGHELSPESTRRANTLMEDWGRTELMTFIDRISGNRDALRAWFGDRVTQIQRWLDLRQRIRDGHPRNSWDERDALRDFTAAIDSSRDAEFRSALHDCYLNMHHEVDARQAEDVYIGLTAAAGNEARRPQINAPLREIASAPGTTDGAQRPLSPAFHATYPSERLETFRRQFGEHARSWTDLSAHAPEVMRYLERQSRFERRLMFESAHDAARANQIRTELEHGRGSQELLALYRDYQAARTPAAQQFESRLQALREWLVREAGMAGIELRAQDLALRIDGYYLNGRNIIGVPFHDLLHSGGVARLTETLLHEGVHREQDVLIIRALAQELSGNGVNLSTREGLQRLTQLYRNRVGDGLDAEFARQVFNQFQQTPLNAAQIDRANRLMESFRLFSSISRPVRDRQGIIRTEAERLQFNSDADTLAVFLREIGVSRPVRLRLANGTTVTIDQPPNAVRRRLLFGTADLPWLDSLLPSLSGGQGNVARACWSITDQMLRHHDNLEIQNRGAYAGALHEREAWFVNRPHNGNSADGARADGPPNIFGALSQSPASALHERRADDLRRLARQYTPLAALPFGTGAEPITIGRGQTTGLSDPAMQMGVSRRHCRFAYENGRATVTDLNSTNGTWLFGSDGAIHRISGTHILQPGEAVLLGMFGPRVEFHNGQLEVLPPLLIRSSQQPPGQPFDWRRPLPTAERVGQMDLSSPSPGIRRVRIDGRSYELDYAGGFLYGLHAESHSDIKLHVTTIGAADLASVQQVLIPALMNDPVLRQCVAGWKTMDPYFASNQSAFAWGCIPDGQLQGAKGFTIYLRNAADATRVQQRLAEILSANNLNLPQTPVTGNGEVLDSRTHRIGISRDYWPAAQNSNGREGFALGTTLTRAICDRLNVASGRNLTAEQLRQIEASLGLCRDSLSYDSTGTGLMLLRVPGGSFDPPHYHGSNLYASEAQAYEPNRLINRGALRQLYHRFGVDMISGR